MAGIEFDRQVFSSAAEAQGKQAPPKAMGVIILVLALGLAGFVGYKLFTQVSQTNAAAAATAQVEQLQQQLAESQKRVEELEKRHKAVKVEPAVAVVQPPAPEKKPAPQAEGFQPIERPAPSGRSVLETHTPRQTVGPGQWRAQTFAAPWHSPPEYAERDTLGPVRSSHRLRGCSWACVPTALAPSL